MWKGSVTDEGDKSIIKFEFGLDEGKKQIQTKDITEGKNDLKIDLKLSDKRYKNLFRRTRKNKFKPSWKRKIFLPNISCKR